MTKPKFTDALAGIVCFLYGLYAAGTGELAHGLMLLALSSLMMDSLDARPDEPPDSP